MNGLSKPWSDDYLRDVFNDEIELARVHRNWFALRFDAPAVMSRSENLVPRRGRSLVSNASRLEFSSNRPTTPPHWRRDWAAAGSLATFLSLSIRFDDEEGCVSVGNGSRRRDVTESYADHPDKDAATWAAIVRAAIRVCTEARELY
jgi:hypothetical protein